MGERFGTTETVLSEIASTMRWSMASQMVLSGSSNSRINAFRRNQILLEQALSSIPQYFAVMDAEDRTVRKKFPPKHEKQLLQDISVELNHVLQIGKRRFLLKYGSALGEVDASRITDVNHDIQFHYSVRLFRINLGAKQRLFKGNICEGFGIWRSWPSDFDHR